MKVKSESEVTQSWLTLSDPMDRSPPGSSVHGIFQARVLEWGGPPNSGRTKLPKNAPTSQLRANEICVRLCFLTEKVMAPHSSTLAWKVPWMEEPGGLQSMGSLRVGHD